MALYRKYRPKKFSEVIGQEAVTKTITEQLKRGEVAHAYLFSGPRGIGKTTTARLLARAVNCIKRRSNQAEPCGECAACAAITSGSALDVFEIDAASHTGVDNVRENIIEASRIPPQAVKTKFFIIDEVHMLSIAAFNALLKILEEPPPNVIFVLATTELHKIPATIISRCQRFDFHRVSPKIMRERLEKIAELEGRKVESEVFDRVIALSDGCIRDAESILSKLFVLDKAKITQGLADLVLPCSLENEVKEFFDCVIRKDKTGIFKLVDRFEQEGVAVSHFLNEMLKFLSHVLRAKAEDHLPKLFENNQFSDWFGSLTSSKMRFLLNSTLDALEQAKKSPNTMLPLELLALVWIDSAGEEQEPPPIILSESTPSGIASESNLQNNDDLKQWRSTLQSVRKKDHALATFLKFGNPVFKGNTVIISFRYKFYHDRVATFEHKEILKETFGETLGRRVQVEFELEEREVAQINDTREEARMISPESNLRFAMQTFGGEIIE